MLWLAISTSVYDKNSSLYTPGEVEIITVLIKQALCFLLILTAFNKLMTRMGYKDLIGMYVSESEGLNFG